LIPEIPYIRHKAVIGFGGPVVAESPEIAWFWMLGSTPVLTVAMDCGHLESRPGPGGTTERERE
jgi:uncharacterized protein YcsI (UPF0317 family)